MQRAHCRRIQLSDPVLSPKVSPSVCVRTLSVVHRARYTSRQTFPGRYRKFHLIPELILLLLPLGQLRTLLEQDSMYGDLLSEFLDATDNPRIAWLHDIALERYDVASETLLREATNEKGVEEKKVRFRVLQKIFLSFGTRR